MKHSLLLLFCWLHPLIFLNSPFKSPLQPPLPLPNHFMCDFHTSLSFFGLLWFNSNTFSSNNLKHVYGFYNLTRTKFITPVQIPFLTSRSLYPTSYSKSPIKYLSILIQSKPEIIILPSYSKNSLPTVFRISVNVTPIHPIQDRNPVVVIEFTLYLHYPPTLKINYLIPMIQYPTYLLDSFIFLQPHYHCDPKIIHYHSSPMSVSILP